jgi:hypothetical protein
MNLSETIRSGPTPLNRDSPVLSAPCSTFKSSVQSAVLYYWPDKSSAASQSMHCLLPESWPELSKLSLLLPFQSSLHS